MPEVLTGDLECNVTMTNVQRSGGRKRKMAHLLSVLVYFALDRSLLL